MLQGPGQYLPLKSLYDGGVSYGLLSACLVFSWSSGVAKMGMKSNSLYEEQVTNAGVEEVYMISMYCKYGWTQVTPCDRR